MSRPCNPSRGWHYFEEGLSRCRCGLLAPRAGDATNDPSYEDDWQPSAEPITREQIVAWLRQWGPYRELEAENERLRAALANPEART